METGVKREQTQRENSMAFELPLRPTRLRKLGQTVERPRNTQFSTLTRFPAKVNVDTPIRCSAAFSEADANGPLAAGGVAQATGNRISAGTQVVRLARVKTLRSSFQDSAQQGVGAGVSLSDACRDAAWQEDPHETVLLTTAQRQARAVAFISKRFNASTARICVRK